MHIDAISQMPVVDSILEIVGKKIKPNFFLSHVVSFCESSAQILL